jgi:hypothetical protein
MKEREHLYLEIPTYHDTVIILASVLFISTQLTYILMYNPIAYRDSHHVLHKGEPDLSPVLDELLSIIKIPTGCTGVLFSFYMRRIHF